MSILIINFLLTKLYRGGRTFTYPEVKELSEDGLLELPVELCELEKEGFVRKIGDGRFRIMADVYTLRKYILENTLVRKEVPEPVKKCEFSRREIIESVWHIKTDKSVPEDDPEEDADDDEDDDDDEEDENMARRFELLELQRERIEQMIKEIGGSRDSDDESEEDEEEDDDEDIPFFEDDEEDSEETSMHKELLDLLTDKSKKGKLMASALKICANEGYISPKLLSKALHIEESMATLACYWLDSRNFVKSSGKEHDKFVMAVPRTLYLLCCHEAENCRDAAGRTDFKKTEENSGKRGGRLPLRKRTDNNQFKQLVRTKLIELIRSDRRMSRAKAITKAEGCLCAARDIGNDAATTVYENMLFDLNSMSDYMFNRLKKQILG